MKYLAVLLLLLPGLASTVWASEFRLECLDAYDGKTRLALIEVNTDSATVKIYSESTHDWKSAVNVSITDATISYVEHLFNDPDFISGQIGNHQPRDRQILRQSGAQPA